jgi:transposase
MLSPGRATFIEFKAPGKKPTPLQAAWHSRLRALGFEVHVIDNVSDFEAICP